MEFQEILKFIKPQKLMQLATVTSEGKPEAAVVEFGNLEDGTIIFDTLTTSRKYTNLQTNTDVACVIGWDKSITVQLEGVAKELSGQELQIAQEAYFAKNPRAAKWANREHIAYFAIKPMWVRYSELSQDPWYVQEFTF